MKFQMFLEGRALSRPLGLGTELSPSLQFIGTTQLAVFGATSNPVITLCANTRAVARASEVVRPARSDRVACAAA